MVVKTDRRRADGTGDETVVTASRVKVFGGRLTPRGSDEAVAVDVGMEPVLAGRNQACQLILRDPRVSSVHAEFVATDRGVRVRDLGSRNGTRIGDVMIVEAFLTEPTTLMLGPMEVAFEPSSPERLGLPRTDSFGPLHGVSPPMRAVFDRIARVAPTELTILIQGETGTGKELVAQAIHGASNRRDGPFVVVDCGAITATLAEAELFGHERGAFTGAVQKRPSPFIEAQGGTLFLDELGELPIDLQPKLLRVMSERRIKPVGARGYHDVDVRVLTATRRDLALEVNAGRFRSDLYFRVAQVRIDLPALRARTEDIPGLIRHMLTELGAPDAVGRVPRESLEWLMRYDWPGNVRELRNAVVAALALSEPMGSIDVAAHVKGAINQQARSAGPLSWHSQSFHEAKREVLSRFEREFFSRLQEECSNVISEMARRAGLERAHVRRYLRDHGLLRRERSAPRQP